MTARDAAARAAAGLVGHLPLNEVQALAGGRLYRKRRRWYAPALVALASLARPRFATLRGAEWRRWEQAVYRELYGEETFEEEGGWLVVPARPGRPLADLLAAEDPAALEGLAAAARGLAAMHRLVLRLPAGPAPLTHGDATAANVTYDTDAGRAWWFDFEQRADPRRPLRWARADDLRALLCSAAARSAIPAQALARAATAYGDAEVLAELHGLLADVAARPDPLHLAQAPLSPARARELAEAAAGIVEELAHA